MTTPTRPTCEGGCETGDLFGPPLGPFLCPRCGDRELGWGVFTSDGAHNIWFCRPHIERDDEFGLFEDDDVALRAAIELLLDPDMDWAGLPYTRDQVAEAVSNNLHAPFLRPRSVRCTECKGFSVQHVDWVDPNTDTVVGDLCGHWHSLKRTGQSYCNDCEEHTLLESVLEEA